jgi:magnesium-transporting ATPase (P-type)
MTRAPVVVLLVVGLVALLQRDGTVAGIIWSIVIINTALSFWREYRAEQAIEKLREILPSFAHIVRNGVENFIPPVTLCLVMCWCLQRGIISLQTLA